MLQPVVSSQSSCSFLAVASDMASHPLLCDTLAARGPIMSHLPAFSPTPLAFHLFWTPLPVPRFPDLLMLEFSGAQSLDLLSAALMILSSLRTFHAIHVLVTPQIYYLYLNLFPELQVFISSCRLSCFWDV